MKGASSPIPGLSLLFTICSLLYIADYSSHYKTIETHHCVFPFIHVPVPVHTHTHTYIYPTLKYMKVYEELYILVCIIPYRNREQAYDMDCCNHTYHSCNWHASHCSMVSRSFFSLLLAIPVMLSEGLLPNPCNCTIHASAICYTCAYKFTARV